MITRDEMNILMMPAADYLKTLGLSDKEITEITAIMKMDAINRGIYKEEPSEGFN